MRQPDVPTDDSPAFARRTNGEDESDSNLTKRWLYLTQIGEDSAPCLAEPNSASKSRSSYSFADYIIIQCATYSDNVADNYQYVHAHLSPPVNAWAPIPFHQLALRCVVILLTDGLTIARIYLLTESFCWINDTLTDPQLVDDAVRGKSALPLHCAAEKQLTVSLPADRYPNCNLFTDTEE